MSKERFKGLLDPRLVKGDWPSIFLSLKNHESWFEIGLLLHDGERVDIPLVHSADSIQMKLAKFGLTISDEKPSDSVERPLDPVSRAKFRAIKENILSNLVKIFCKEEMIARHRYLIRCVPERNGYGMMEPAYIQLLFHTHEEAAAILSLIRFADQK